jgi:hypothetical protein
VNTNHDQPPSTWDGVNATPAGGDIYYRSDPELGEPGTLDSILVWHWCTAVAPGDGEVVSEGRWAASWPSAHTLVCAVPLHLEPSLLFKCCGVHGFIRNGRWTAA